MILFAATKSDAFPSVPALQRRRHATQEPILRSIVEVREEQRVVRECRLTQTMTIPIEVLEEKGNEQVFDRLAADVREVVCPSDVFQEDLMCGLS